MKPLERTHMHMCMNTDTPPASNTRLAGEVRTFPGKKFRVQLTSTNMIILGDLSNQIIVSHQLICASIHLAHFGLVSSADSFHIITVSYPSTWSLLTLLLGNGPNRAPKFTAWSGNQFKETILQLAPFIPNSGNMHRCRCSQTISAKTLDQYI